MIADVHAVTAWITVVLAGVAGVWGLVLALRRRFPGRAFWTYLGSVVALLLLQVGLGLWMRIVDDNDPGSQHVFYGILILFSLSFAYIFRPQLAKRPALGWGLLILFVMGLGIRAMTTFGQDF